MNKLYIDQQGIIKVIDVPEEPELTGDVDVDRHNAVRYAYGVAAAKEAGIPFDQEQIRDIMMVETLSNDSIHNLPEGWTVEISERAANIMSENPFAVEKVAVLLPPVSEKPPIHHAQRAIRDEQGKVIGFEPFNKAKLKDACRETKAQAREITNQILSDSNAALNNAVSEKVESQEELWTKVIFDARFYNGSPADLQAITTHLKKFYTVSRIK